MVLEALGKASESKTDKPVTRRDQHFEELKKWFPPETEDYKHRINAIRTHAREALKPYDAVSGRMDWLLEQVFLIGHKSEVKDGVMFVSPSGESGSAFSGSSAYPHASPVSSKDTVSVPYF